MSKQQNEREPCAAPTKGPMPPFSRATEIDTRMIGMIVALILIWCAFDIASGILRGNFGGLLGGSFLTPRNLWTLLDPDVLHRHHDHRHGAAHRHAADRSVGRLDAQPHGRRRRLCFRLSTGAQSSASAIPPSGSWPIVRHPGARHR